MSIEFLSGDIFLSDTEAIVNAVNCVGVMGKGIALEFKKRYPEMYQSYRLECINDRLKPGKVHIFKQKSLYIVNFPTKIHWRDNSKIEWIEAGLARLFAVTIPSLGISSIAIPALGCKNGGLDWHMVKSCFQKWHSIFDDMLIYCKIKVYEAQK